MSAVLLIAAQPIRTTEQLCEKIKAVTALGHQVTLWSYSEVPDEVRGIVSEVNGPQKTEKKTAKGSAKSNKESLGIIFRVAELFRRVVNGLKRKIFIRFRRDLVWLQFRSDRLMNSQNFYLVAAVDSRAIFAAWKFQRRNSTTQGLANLTNLVEACKQLNN